MHHDARVRAAALLTTLLTTAIALTVAGCAPPGPATHEHDHRRTGHAPHHPAPRITDVFPDGKAVSAASYWHDNPELMPQALEGSTLLFDAAGSGASTIAVPETSPEESLVLVLTCAHTSTYSLALVREGSSESLASTGGESCGGPRITVFSAPPVDLSGAPTAVDVDVPEDTAYFLAIYRTPGAPSAS